MNIFELIGTISLEGAEAVGNQINSVGYSLQSMGNNISNFGRGLIDNVTKPILEIGQSSIMLASDLNEVANVVNTTFGKSGGEVIAWSKTLLDKYGMVELESQKYVGSMGAMLTSSGLSADASKNMAERLVELTGDMSSFYNLSHEEVWEKIRAGIGGETEPLKALGINMSVANMEAFALAQGIKKPWKEMSQSEQTQLRYNYLMQQTALAQGDFARTSDGFANQLRVVQGKLGEVSLAFGQLLLPYALKAVEFISMLVDKFKDLDDNARKIIIVVALVAAAMGPIILIIGGVVTALGVFISAIGTIISVVALLTPEIIGVGIAIGAVTAIFVAIGVAIASVLYYTGAFKVAWDLLKVAFETAKPIIMSLANEAIELLKQAFIFLKDILDKFAVAAKPVLQDLFQQAKPIVIELVKAIGDFASTLIDKVSTSLTILKAIWDKIWPSLEPIVTSVFNIIKTNIVTILAVIKDLINIATAIMKGDWSAVWNGIKDIAITLWNQIKNNTKEVLNIIANTIEITLKAILLQWSTIWNGIKTTLSAVWDGMKSIASSAFNVIDSVISAVLGRINSNWLNTWNSIKSFFSGVWENIKSMASNAVNALSNTLSTIYGKVRTAIDNIPSAIRNISSDAYNGAVAVGKAIIDGIVNAIKNGLSSVINAAKNIATSAIKAAKDALGVKSPSTVFADIGDNVTQGFIGGLDADKIKNVMGDLANTIVNPLNTVSIPTLNPVGIGNGSVTNNNLNINEIKLNVSDVGEIQTWIDFFNKLRQEAMSRR